MENELVESKKAHQLDDERNLRLVKILEENVVIISFLFCYFWNYFIWSWKIKGHLTHETQDLTNELDNLRRSLEEQKISSEKSLNDYQENLKEIETKMSLLEIEKTELDQENEKNKSDMVRFIFYFCFIIYYLTKAYQY